jgi:hypothetical protein
MKKKSKILMVLLILISFACKSQEIKRIDILYVDNGIETPFRIKCDKFEEFFGARIDSISVQDPKLIEKLSNELNNLVHADKSKYALPDTRIKLSISFNNQTNLSICIDRIVVSKSGELFLYSDSLRETINDIVCIRGRTKLNNSYTVL